MYFSMYTIKIKVVKTFQLEWIHLLNTIRNHHEKEFLHKTPLFWPFPLITLQWKYLKYHIFLKNITQFLNYSVGVPHLYISV